MRGGFVLGLEDTGSRMSRLGESELFHERILGVDEVLDRIDAVSVADVHQVAADLFGGHETLALVGPS